MISGTENIPVQISLHSMGLGGGIYNISLKNTTKSIAEYQRFLK